MAGLVRAAADRREGLARLHGQVNALRTRAAAADDEIGRLRDARQEAVARAERAQREFTSLETRVAGLDAGEEGLDAEHEAASALLDDITARLEKARDEVQHADRERSALAARKEALEMGLCRRDGAGALLAATDQVSGLLGSVAALLSVRAGLRDRRGRGPRLRRRRGRRGRPRRGRRRDRPPQDPRPRPCRAGPRRRRRRLRRPARLWPGLPGHASYAVDAVDCPDELRPSLARLLHKVAVVDDLAAARSLVADLPDVTAVTREGDVLGAVRGVRAVRARSPACSRSRPPSTRPRPSLSEATALCERLGFRHLPSRERAARRPAARRRRPGQAPRVRRDAGRRRRAAGPVRLAGPVGPGRGRAPRQRDRQRRGRARPGPRRPGRPRAAARRRRGRARRGARHHRARAARRGRARRPRPRDGGTAGSAHLRGARAGARTAAPTRCSQRRRPSATPGPGPPSGASA